MVKGKKERNLFLRNLFLEKNREAYREQKRREKGKSDGKSEGKPEGKPEGKEEFNFVDLIHNWK